MSAATSAGGGDLVLNVNDHPGVRYLITRMLDRAGFRVIEAADGETALRSVQERQPRLVVLDIKLPDISGLEVCRRIKADPQLASVKVLHTSAVFVAPEAKVQSLNSGADGYLSHPFEQEELIATARSLLRLVEAEKKLRDTAEELKAANQRIHEFLAMLGHELRNPLSAIATSLPLLEREGARPDAALYARQVIRRQTDNLRRMVDDLLDAARVTQGKIEPRREPVDLVSLLTRVGDNFRRGVVAERRQELVLRLPESPVRVTGDPLRLEQVFNNLVDNASKYTPNQGHIEVTLATTPSARARVQVRDDGVGIPPQALPTIFKLFSQADVPLARSRGGLGIGLTLVRSLVELHGGTVQATSAGEGAGCVFEVELPLTVDPAPTVAVPESLPAARAERRRIVIVEDNVDAQQMLKCLLELWGHEVRAASDGEAGLRAIREERPDIALVDIGLPLLDGYEVARLLRDSPFRSGLLLVALTGYGSPEQRNRALEAGFDLHLVKPVDPQELSGLIAQCGVSGRRASASN